jgi:hypothetical protein
LGYFIVKDDVLAFDGTTLNLGFVESSSFVDLIYLILALPSRAWKISSTFLFSLAEHCMAAQKP